MCRTNSYVPLQILSQGSNPLSLQPYYEKIFDAIDKVSGTETLPWPTPLLPKLRPACYRLSMTPLTAPLFPSL